LGVARIKRRGVLLLLVAGLQLPAISAWAGQAQESASSERSLPEAPQPQSSAAPASAPCPAANAALPAAPAAGNAPAGASGQSPTKTQPLPCPPKPEKNWFERFLTGPEVKPMTPKEKAWLAARNEVDIFNAITILGSSAIAVGSDANSPYGPGMKGFGRYVGVSYTEDLTGEFFSTFLIPSIVHQDPHYHRMPSASIPRRVRHAIVQVIWTQGDNGKPMVNYADVAGFAIEDAVANLYVPGQQTDLPASAERYVTGLATAPIDNFITEFLPDVARRIHVRVVLIQRIINQVAKTPGAGQD
jgi:hypothetical protein